MHRLLITGANGQVGRSLVQQLVASFDLSKKTSIPSPFFDETIHNSLEQLPPHSLGEYHFRNSQCELLALDRIMLDITHKEVVFNIIKSFKPTIVINTAAYTNVDRAEKETSQADAVNHLGAKYLAQATASINAQLLHLSTDYVFDGQFSGYYKETDTVNPQTAYGRTKLAGEIAVQSFNPQHIILRTSWVFGEYGSNFVKTILGLAQKQSSLSIVSDQVGAPTYAGDIAHALIKMVHYMSQHSIKGIYHFSGIPYVSWYEFAQVIFNIAHTHGLIEKIPDIQAITTKDYPTLALRPSNSRLNLSKIKQVFDIEPSHWQRGLNHLFTHLNSQSST